MVFGWGVTPRHKKTEPRSLGISQLLIFIVSAKRAVGVCLHAAHIAIRHVPCQKCFSIILLCLN